MKIRLGIPASFPRFTAAAADIGAPILISANAMRRKDGRFMTYGSSTDPQAGPAAVRRTGGYKARPRVTGLTNSTMPSKYRSVKTEVDGIVFDSKKEAERWAQLKLLVKAKAITHLERQKPFDVVINGRRICRYKADFVYFQNGTRFIEDVKGFATPLYKLKKKLVEAMFNLMIIEV